MAVIRCSGPDAKSILTQVSGRQELVPRHMYHGLIQDPKTGDVLDDACYVFFEGPASFTGEDSFEIQGHSSLPVIKQVLALCCALGAEPAKEGEFTKRAFINGKIDLSKAESISDLIHAKSSLSSKVALNQLQGALYQKIQTIRHHCKLALENIEASIDFPDEVDPPDSMVLQSSIQETLAIVDDIIAKQDYGKYINSGVTCLIVGYPNVGKSSLLNQLLGEERAIVSDVAGTTRDFIESTIEIGGVHFELIDTAGFRETENQIEAMGIKRIEDLLPKADVVLWVLDQSRELNESEKELATLISMNTPPSKVYHLLNKSDQTRVLTIAPKTAQDATIQLSAITGDGIDALKQHLHDDFAVKAQNLSDSAICNIRQLSCLQKVQDHLREVNKALSDGMTLDMLVIDLKQAILSCGDITGDHLTEEVLDGVFSRFCVGK